MTLSRRALLLALPPLMLPGRGRAADTPRNPDWAVPVAVPGADNLHRVTPLFYRSAQPDAVGFRNLETLGIRTVISMRQLVADEPLAQGTTLTLHRVPIKSRYVAEDDGERIVRVLRLLRDGMDGGPVLVHCRHGADRTGAISALYRMLYQGWPREAAIAEMEQGGFNFHPVWDNIPRYLRRVDLADLATRIAA